VANNLAAAIQAAGHASRTALSHGVRAESTRPGKIRYIVQPLITMSRSSTFTIRSPERSAGHSAGEAGH